MSNITEIIGAYALPVIVLLILVIGFAKKVPLFDAFVDGVKQSLPSLVRLIPVMVGLVTAVTVFRAGEAAQFISNLVSPIAKFLGFSSELIPLAILKPISGSASATLAADIMEQFGPDSITGVQAAILLGCGDTVMYVISVYFGSAGIKKLRYAILPILVSSAVVILLL